MYKQALSLAKEYKDSMARFLRDIIAIPGESGSEGARVERIKQEMLQVGFDRVEIDAMGNVLGFIGTGQRLIAMDAHIDTTAPGDLRNWTVDPYKGYEDDQIIIGRGASDQLGGIVSAVYAGRIINELDLQGDFTLVVTGTVQEEDCDGWCWRYLIEEYGLRPEFVLLTEPTNGKVVRGQRGRVEICVSTTGVSSHGSAPERGENAIYKMAPILLELHELNQRLPADQFLGRGSLAVSEIFFSSPSRCSVADGCTISIDRRLTAGETRESALEDIKKLPAVQRAGATVEVYQYHNPSYTGYRYPVEAYFPTWIVPEDEPCVKIVADIYTELFKEQPVVDKWTFSTNGVGIMGAFGIPCVGFGPGREEEAHAPDEKTWKDDLVRAAALYSVVPITYVKKMSAF